MNDHHPSQQTESPVDEVRRVRGELAALYDFDLRRIMAAAIEEQQRHPERYVSRAPRPVRPAGDAADVRDVA